MEKRYAIPYKVKSNMMVTMHIELLAKSKTQAREQAVKILSTDRDVAHIGNINYIVCLGEPIK